MAAAFSGAYTDTSVTTRGPFSQSSTAVDVKNVRDLGNDRSYTESRSQVRGQDYASQQTDPKPFPGEDSDKVAYDPYAVGGGVASYLSH
tara:strand:- start:3827 stop:4093 length:267 start_codon:yes stop_codon:yes gene_type:complete